MDGGFLKLSMTKPLTCSHIDGFYFLLWSLVLGFLGNPSRPAGCPCCWPQAGTPDLGLQLESHEATYAYLFSIIFSVSGRKALLEDCLDEVDPGACYLDYYLMQEGSAHCGWYHPYSGGPGLYKKASQTGTSENQGTSQQIALLYGSCLQVPVLSSLPVFKDGLWSESTIHNEPVLPQVAFSQSILSQQQNSHQKQQQFVSIVSSSIFLSIINRVGYNPSI